MTEKTQLDRIESDVKQIRLTIEGDGTDSRPGMRMELDRLKQARTSDTWWRSTTIGAALTALGAMAVNWLSSR